MLDKWNLMARPPENALKKINAGRLSGKTDINPQWRLKVMTENYGECGIGWKYEIIKLWTEPGSDNQVIAFAEIKLYTFSAEFNDWSNPIPGIGGSMMLVQETKGLHTNDECYKMAVTDALSVAMKSLGVAADIYMGLWDGSKYKDSQGQYTDEFYSEPNGKHENTQNNATQKEPDPKEVALKCINKWIDTGKLSTQDFNNTVFSIAKEKKDYLELAKDQAEEVYKRCKAVVENKKEK
jgi:hypothetical protein